LKVFSVLFSTYVLIVIGALQIRRYVDRLCHMHSVGWLMCCRCCRNTGLRHWKQSSSLDGWRTEAVRAGNAHLSRQWPWSLG